MSSKYSGLKGQISTQVLNNWDQLGTLRTLSTFYSLDTVYDPETGTQAKVFNSLGTVQAQFLDFSAEDIKAHAKWAIEETSQQVFIPSELLSGSLKVGDIIQKEDSRECWRILGLTNTVDVMYTLHVQAEDITGLE